MSHDGDKNPQRHRHSLLLRQLVDPFLWLLRDPFRCTTGCWQQAFLGYDVQSSRLMLMMGLLRRYWPTSLGPSLKLVHEPLAVMLFSAFLRR